MKKAFSVDSSFSDCDLIFLCCPVEINIQFLQQLSSILSKECIVTDVGSTKENIIEFAKTLESPVKFIGGHPMTGSDQSGYSAAKPHLFENAYYVLSPVNVEKSYIEKLYHFVQAIHALPIIIDPKQHDYITGAISHTPHLIASALVNLVQTLDTKEQFMHTLAAGGFKDITRIASSSPTMWKQICMTNHQNIVDILSAFKDNLLDIIHMIENKDEEALHNFFLQAKEYRDSFQDKTSPLVDSYALTVDVEDQPGIIAEIATLLSGEDINIKNIGIMNNREYTSGVLEIVFYDQTSRETSIHILQKMNYAVYKR